MMKTGLTWIGLMTIITLIMLTALFIVLANTINPEWGVLAVVTIPFAFLFYAIDGE